MPKRFRFFLRIFFLLSVFAVGGSLFVTAKKGVESSLIALLGDAAEGGLRKVASAMASSAKFLVKAESQDAARRRLMELGLDLPLPESEQRSLKALSQYVHGFLSPDVCRLMEGGNFAAVRDAAAARLFSPVPPVVSPQEDPFLLFTDYILSSSQPRGEWVSVNVEMTPAQALTALAAVKGAEDVRCAGSPFHTAVASDSSRREINVISVISTACVALFGWLLTRTMRFLPILLLALVSAFCISTAALFAFFRQPHIITMVFGTTLIGMSVDYVYHSLSARSSIVKPLTASFLSTAACFLPLLFSDVEILNQIAVFTVSGLAAVYVGVVAFSRFCMKEGPRDVVQGEVFRAHQVRFAKAKIFVIAVIVALPVLCAMLFGSSDAPDISRMYSPDPYLMEGERIALEMNGGESFIPSPERQSSNFRLVKRLYAEEGTNYCQMVGLPFTVLSLPENAPVFAPKEALDGALARWQNETKILLHVSMLILFAVFALAYRKDALDFIIPILVAYSSVFTVLTCLGESTNFFATICFFIFMGLGFDYSVFRRHLMHTGEGNPTDRTCRAVFYSFLTSFVGFGLLAFTDFAVTRLMGIVLAVGLASSYIASKACCGISQSLFAKKEADDTGIAWHKQREQCASVFWAQFMWYSYAFLGKNFQKAVFVIGMPVIYFLSKQGRTALKKFYSVLSEFTGRDIRATPPRLFMHILGFAWGLMDKTDSCTLQKDSPAMNVRDDDGWRCFRDVVNSGKGAFLLCTHVGMIGVLPSLPNALARSGESAMRIPVVNAFQQMGHDAVFMKVFMKHFDSTRLRLHAVEDIGVETAVEMKDAIGRGELVIMAGDRISAGSKAILRHRFLGRDCVWPKGVYRFAKLMESPVFAVTCVRTGWNRYEVHFSALGKSEPVMLDGFVSFLERETVAYPEQWYQFYDFFGFAT